MAAEPEHDVAEPLASGDTVTVEKTDTEPEPIPVAEQKAAGVPPEQTVTIADQKAGVPPPPLPEDGDAVPEPVDVLPASAGNESPMLPPNAVAAAAHAHAYFEHLKQMANAAQADIERWVPPNVLAAAKSEAGLMIRSIL